MHPNNTIIHDTGFVKGHQLSLYSRFGIFRLLLWFAEKVKCGDDRGGKRQKRRSQGCGIQWWGVLNGYRVRRGGNKEGRHGTWPASTACMLRMPPNRIVLHASTPQVFLLRPVLLPLVLRGKLRPRSSEGERTQLMQCSDDLRMYERWRGQMKNGCTQQVAYKDKSK